MNKKPIKHCHECKHFLPPERPTDDPACAQAAANSALSGYPILHTVKFQRGSNFVTDCGPAASLWEPLS